MKIQLRVPITIVWRMMRRTTKDMMMWSRLEDKRLEHSKLVPVESHGDVITYYYVVVHYL
jgi:hypothetical protein